MKAGYNDVSQTQPGTKGTLGTFAGVFTPSILTILGIILFLRLGYVTGSVGVAHILLIIVIANVITILTSLSLAAIATNIKVKGGGDYYLISRTLGVEFGGALGIVLYLAQSVSVAFYCIGFSEALNTILGPEALFSPRIIAIMAAFTIFILAWLGADIATKFQYIVMGLLIAALSSFFIGGIPQWQPELFKSNWLLSENTSSFWIAFGIFFPAVTGFTQGVSMSGDLRDPGKSLPRGTFLAVFLSIIIYLAMVIVFGGVLSRETMVNDYQSIKLVSRYGFLIDAGVIAATLSSAMASFLGGPRILQSLAKDKVFPLLTPFSKGSGATENPRRAILLTGAIAICIILLGQLNLVARIVSMFFLISYGLLNYATYYEANSESPSFRPRFNYFHKYLSLAGFLSCFIVILLMDLQYGLVAIAILAAIHQYVQRTVGLQRWSAGKRSHSLNVIRKELYHTSTKLKHDRDWRPNILAFTKDLNRRPLLLQFGEWLSGNSGTVTAVKIVEGGGVSIRSKKEKELVELKRSVQKHQQSIFPMVIAGQDVSETMRVLLQSYGIGPLKGNTFLCNWYGETLTSFPGLDAMKFGHNLRLAFQHGYNLVVFHCEVLNSAAFLESKKKNRTIDVWYHDDANSRLMLLFAYLMTRNEIWSEASIRVLTDQGDTIFNRAMETLTQELDDARITAEPLHVIDMTPETILQNSSKSDLIFLPFLIKHSMLVDRNGYSFERILTKLPPAALVMAAEDIDLDAEPEEGSAGILADAMDNLHKAEKLHTAAEKKFKELEKELSELEKECEDLASNNDSAKLQDIGEKRALCIEKKDLSFRKVAKTKAKLDSALEHITLLQDNES